MNKDIFQDLKKTIEYNTLSKEELQILSDMLNDKKVKLQEDVLTKKDLLNKLFKLALEVDLEFNNDNQRDDKYVTDLLKKAYKRLSFDDRWKKDSFIITSDDSSIFIKSIIPCQCDDCSYKHNLAIGTYKCYSARLINYRICDKCMIKQRVGYFLPRERIEFGEIVRNHYATKFKGWRDGLDVGQKIKRECGQKSICKNDQENDYYAWLEEITRYIWS